MPFDLKCAYRVLLDLIYMHGGGVPDDAGYISGLLGCSKRKWSAIRAGLIGLRKIEVRGDKLGNYRADFELETLRKLQDIKRENRAAANKINRLPERPFDHTEPDTDTERDIPPPPVPTTARELAAVAMVGDPTDREQMLAVMGHDPSGLTATGRIVGSPGDMREAQRWQSDLGLTLAEILDVIRETMARKRDGPPTSFAYFRPAMQRRAGEKQAPPIAAVAAPRQPNTAEILNALDWSRYELPPE
jgi:uncharacterized protein YdaU (DUF1376 family)